MQAGIELVWIGLDSCVCQRMHHTTPVPLLLPLTMLQALDDADDGPPELLFVHAGQSAKLNDFAWNSSEDWLVAGVSDDNQLQVRLSWHLKPLLTNDDAMASSSLLWASHKLRVSLPLTATVQAVRVCRLV
jgi:hypothetical protein